MTQIHGQISVSAVWDYATCRSVKKKEEKKVGFVDLKNAKKETFLKYVVNLLQN